MTSAASESADDKPKGLSPRQILRAKKAVLQEALKEVDDSDFERASREDLQLALIEHHYSSQMTRQDVQQDTNSDEIAHTPSAEHEGFFDRSLLEKYKEVYSKSLMKLTPMLERCSASQTAAECQGVIEQIPSESAPSHTSEQPSFTGSGSEAANNDDAFQQHELRVQKLEQKLEQLERANRSCNVVIYGIGESLVHGREKEIDAVAKSIAIGSARLASAQDKLHRSAALGQTVLQ